MSKTVKTKRSGGPVAGAGEGEDGQIADLRVLLIDVLLRETVLLEVEQLVWVEIVCRVELLQRGQRPLLHLRRTVPRLVDSLKIMLIQ